MKVLGEGPPDARIAIVGEAPGREESACGRPFVGSSGRLLNAMLGAVGIARSECYVTNVLKFQPPGNNFAVVGYAGREPTQLLRQARSELVEELHRVGPRVVVALGNEALRALTGHGSVSKWRGSVIAAQGLKVIPTYHPAAILRMYEWRPVAELDLRKALRESLSCGFNHPIVDFTIDPSLEETMQFLQSIQPGATIAVDIETVGKVIRCVGIATSGERALCIPLTSSTHKLRPGGQRLLEVGTVGGSGAISHHWSESEEALVHAELRRVLEDPQIAKITQNHPFDSLHIRDQLGIAIEGLWMDTMVLHHVCWSELPKGLDFLASVYTDIPYWSDYDSSSDRSTWTYNCWDCVATFQVALRLEREAKELGVWEFYHHTVQPAMLALCRAGFRGIEVDTAVRDQLHTECEQNMARTKERLTALAGIPVNPDSPKQVGELLYGKLKLPVQHHRRTGKPTTDEDALRVLAGKSDLGAKVIAEILSYRESSTLKGTFLEAPLFEGHVMRTSFNITGTVNGRISSSKIIILDEGGNLQNIPRGSFRRLYRARPGMTLVKTDLSQAEARVVAWSAGIRRIIDRWVENPRWDIHTWNASANIWKIPPELVTKAQRQKSKASVHAGNYRMGDRSAAKLYSMPVAEARFIREAYLAAIPEIPMWWSEIEDQLQRTRELRTPQGRRRVFFGRLDDELFRSAYAFIPQSVVGDRINDAFVEGERVLAELGWGWPLLQVHDEIVWEIHTEHLSSAIPVIRDLLERPVVFPRVPEPLVIPADLTVGPNWFDQQEPQTVV